jgi:hypothetical protein
MKRSILLVLTIVLFGLGGCASQERSGAAGWRDQFAVDKAKLADTGRNPFFILEPGYKLEMTAAAATLTITVLGKTEIVDGVVTRVVEERETKRGALIEVSRNFFAIDPGKGDLYYFGEDVDIYKGGKIVSHEGAWRSGVRGARFGLMIAGTPRLGDRYYQEIAPEVAMDRVEIVALDETFETPAGTFKNCLRMKETSAIEAGSGVKIYAPGVGLVKDDEFVLVRYGKI